MTVSPIELLLCRKSHNKLAGKSPTKQQLHIMFKAALRAPDHARLRPWRYLVFEQESLNQLGEYFVEASRAEGNELSELQVSKLRSKPLRAPMVVIAISHQKEHPRVPVLEQVLSVGASVQNFLMAAHFLGIGAIWRTGKMAFNQKLCNLLGLAKNECIVGFIYLGEEQGEVKPVPDIDQTDYVEWYT